MSEVSTIRAAIAQFGRDEARNWDTIQRISDADITGWAEYLGRTAMMSVFCMALIGWADHVTAVYLIVIYFGLDSLYHYVLSGLQNPVSRAQLFLVLGLYFVTTCSLALIPAHLWATGEPALRLSALLLLVAIAIYFLSRHASIPMLALWDGVLIMAGATAVGVTTFDPAGGTGMHWTLGTLGGLVGLYYLLALRTAVVSHRALIDAEARTIQARRMETIGRITGGVAHDFNNLLTIVQGNFELWKECGDSRERDALIAEAHAAAGRGAALTAKMLTAARNTPMTPQTVPVDEFLLAFRELIHRMMPSNIELRTDVAADLPAILADRTLLDSALLNLVINACDAMPTGGRIVVSAARGQLGHRAPLLPERSGAASFIRISVEDTGPGIPPQYADLVTEPFFTLKPNGEGSGLGLSMAKGFAEASGGELQIQRGTDGGALVTLVLPRDPHAAGIEAPASGAAQVAVQGELR